MKAVLIDDEKYATELLAMKLAKLELGVQVLAHFNQPEAALEFVRQTPFDVLFLDIQMPRLNGFDLLAQLPSVPFDVVFTTAYDQYAVQAFRVSALNYLLKPVQESELRQVIELWQQRGKQPLPAPQYALFQEYYQPSASPARARIALPTQEGHEIVEIADIIRCVAEAGYTYIHRQTAPPLLICRTLKEVSQALEPSGFVRVHHSHTINPAFLRKIVRQEGGYLLLSDGAQVPVTKLKRDFLLEQIAGIERR